MKKIKDLNEYGEPKGDDRPLENVRESMGVSSIKRSKDAPDKAKFRFEVSDNMKKVAKIQKELIDTLQLLNEMADEIVALKVNFPNMDPESMEIMNNMAYNIKNLINSLKSESKKGSETGMFDNMGRLKRNLERLKIDYINK